MALTLVVRSSPVRTPDAAPELSLTFDSPRLVIGRGDAADLRLPDPSVSHRHASLRARGSEYVLIDEGSTNGTFLGRVRLAPQSPRVVRSGELIRVGRVWLEVRVEAGMANATPAAAAKQVALELVSRSLGDQGEDVRPRLRVVEGPDAGKELLLEDPSKRYVLGRAREADLTLEDADASRRHVEISLRGAEVWVLDLGSKSGVALDDTAVLPEGSAWRPGMTLTVGANRLALTHAAAEALAELERSPDERMGRDEVVPLPEEPEPEPGSGEQRDAPPATPAPAEAGSEPRSARNEASAASAGWSLTDGAVLILAVGVLLISVAALLWLLAH